jgi:hypothetical protein
MPMSGEAVATAQLARTGGAAELGLLDRAAAEANQMMMVTRVAADVGRTRVSDERTNRAGPAKELHRSVDGRQAELGCTAARLLEEIDGREAPIPVGDQIQQ